MTQTFRRGSEMTIQFNRDLNFETSRQIQKELADIVIPEEVQNLKIELHKVKFIDSAGVGFLVGWIHPLSSKYEISIGGASRSIKAILTICKLDQIVRIL